MRRRLSRGVSAVASTAALLLAPSGSNVVESMRARPPVSGPASALDGRRTGTGAVKGGPGAIVGPSRQRRWDSVHDGAAGREDPVDVHHQALGQGDVDQRRDRDRRARRVAGDDGERSALTGNHRRMVDGDGQIGLRLGDGVPDGVDVVAGHVVGRRREHRSLPARVGPRAGRGRHRHRQDEIERGSRCQRRRQQAHDRRALGARHARRRQWPGQRDGARWGPRAG